MTKRDTLNPSAFPNSSSCPVPPDNCRDAWLYPPPGWTITDERAVPPPSLWPALLAIVLIVAAIAYAVMRGMDWWQAGTLSLVMFAGMSLSFGGIVAEAGRDAGVVR